jgi:hypothetical protein
MGMPEGRGPGEVPIQQRGQAAQPSIRRGSVVQRGDNVGGSRARVEAPGSGTRYPGATSGTRVSWPNGEAMMAGPVRRGDGTPTSWGGPERGGGCARRRRWRRREGAVASVRRRTANGRGQRELGWSRGRGRGGREATHAGRLTDDARKTAMWDGRWRLRDGRTADYSYLLNK